MSDILLSICISSYNKGDKCCKLVQRILALEDDRYNIFICDDCSNEETTRKLRMIRDPKFTLVEHAINVGPCKNWYKTIDCGNGRYILHVLDRDDININSLIAVLDILEKHSVGAGYIGKSAMSLDIEKHRKKDRFAICKKGREAFLTMAGVPIHPTGFLVNRKRWKKGNYKKFFYQYEKYGIYPHSYVLGVIALQSDMLYMPISFYHYVYNGENAKSAFYEKLKNRDYWWLPYNITKTTNLLILYLYSFADNEYKEDFICMRFRNGLHRATIVYRTIVANSSEMGHYGIKTSNISKAELLLISLKYEIAFVHILNKLEVCNKRIGKRLTKIWLANVADILLM